MRKAGAVASLVAQGSNQFEIEQASWRKPNLRSHEVSTDQFVKPDTAQDILFMKK